MFQKSRLDVVTGSFISLAGTVLLSCHGQSVTLLPSTVKVTGPCVVLPD